MSELGSVGKYQLIRPLAQGGMGEIFIARQSGPAGFGKTVVVKRILSHLAKNREFIDTFLDEARLSAQLSHPNIVQIFDFGEDSGTYFLAMEYLAGEDVADILRALGKKDQAMPFSLAAAIVGLVCEGLDYAHNAVDEEGRPLAIVHRDVSPSNVFVTFQGAVKILDFGIAKAAGKIVQTEDGAVKGKFVYMAPEQAQAKPIDKRSDVFSLGAVFYEMVTGVRLFQRDNFLATLSAVTTDRIPPPSSIDPAIPLELEEVIMKALERDPEARFQSALEMRKPLDSYLASRTYAPVHVQLRQFLVDLLGEEEVALRSRSPLGAGTPPTAGRSPDEMLTVRTPTSEPGRRLAAEPRPATRQLTPGRIVPPPSFQRPPTPPNVHFEVPSGEHPLPPRKRGALPLLLGAIVIGVLGVGVGWVLFASKSGGGPKENGRSPAAAESVPAPAGEAVAAQPTAEAAAVAAPAAAAAGEAEAAPEADEVDAGVKGDGARGDRKRRDRDRKKKPARQRGKIDNLFETYAD